MGRRASNQRCNKLIGHAVVPCPDQALFITSALFSALHCVKCIVNFHKIRTLVREVDAMEETTADDLNEQLDGFGFIN